MKKTVLGIQLLSLFLFFAAFVTFAEAGDAVPGKVIFRNVRVFDGSGAPLTEATNVVVEGNIVRQIASDVPAPSEGDTVIEGGGNVLMPGMIDNHWHSMLSLPTNEAAAVIDAGYLNILASVGAREALMRGFTSLRDMGGPSFSLKLAIDQGLIPGPRIYPAGAMISQTGGHGDFRMPYEIPRDSSTPLSHTEQIGAAAIADSPDDVRLRTREQLMKGAVLIKVMAGGGVASLYDPLDAVQYTEPEIRAAVEAAENWGTYVTVHAYTSKAVQMAIRAGVKCIEHGQLADEETVKMIAENNVWWSLQPFLDDEDANKYKDNSSRKKQLQTTAGTDNAYKLAKKYNLKVAWGTDILGSPVQTKRQGARLLKMLKWYTPPEILAMVTSTNAELLALSGLRNPYPGKLGVVEEGALADLLLVKGDPTKDLELMEKPDENLLVIMKDGKIYKNID